MAEADAFHQEAVRIDVTVDAVVAVVRPSFADQIQVVGRTAVDAVAAVVGAAEVGAGIPGETCREDRLCGKKETRVIISIQLTSYPSVALLKWLTNEVHIVDK